MSRYVQTFCRRAATETAVHTHVCVCTRTQISSLPLGCDKIVALASFRAGCPRALLRSLGRQGIPSGSSCVPASDQVVKQQGWAPWSRGGERLPHFPKHRNRINNNELGYCAKT